MRLQASSPPGSSSDGPMPQAKGSHVCDFDDPEGPGLGWTGKHEDEAEQDWEAHMVHAYFFGEDEAHE